MKMTRLASAMASLLLTWPALAGGNGYFQFPSLQNDVVVFASEGDLWSTSLSGGTARRLTTHPAEESRPSISPDGKWIAFSAAYEGPREVYVMPIAGGTPTRLTYDQGDALPIGWTTQGEVIYSTPHTFGPQDQHVVVTINPNTFAKRTLPLTDVNDATIDERGEYVYFVRFGLAETRDNARGYRGGAMSQLWRYNLKTGREAERIGPKDANVRRPIWWNGRIVVVSDQDGRDNLWSLKADGSDATQLTRHSDFDIRSASLGNGKVIYQLAADLHVFDLATKRDQTLDINLVSDFDQTRARWIDKPLRFLTDTSFAPDGEHVAVTVRGRTSLAGIGQVRRVDLAQPTGSRLDQASVSPDGKWVYAFCDATGEQEIWRFPADGSEGGKALTTDGKVARIALLPSPDGKSLLHSDKHGKLWLLDLASGKNDIIDDAQTGGTSEYAGLVWSPDSRAIAMVRSSNQRQTEQIGLYSLDKKQLTWVTSDKYPSMWPSFSPDGKWLWFVSARQYTTGNRGPWGDRNTGTSFDRRDKVYGLALQAGTRFPFQPKDELQSPKPAGDDKADDKKTEDKKDDKKDATKDSKAKLPAIQFDGLAERLFEVPLAAGNYRHLQTDGKRLYVLDGNELKTLSIDNTGPKAETFATDVAEFELSQEGKKLFYRRGNDDNRELLIVEAGAKAPADLSKAIVRLNDWNLLINPRDEWQQMFADTWRNHRDSLFDPALRGVNWLAVRQKYAPLLDRIRSRHELNSLLGQMVAELGALHSQVRSGDVRLGTDGAIAASLGAVMSPVEQGWRIDHLYQTERELPSERGPLDAPGVDVKVGDIITAINGRATRGLRDIGDLLRNQAGQQVLLDIKRGEQPIRKAVVTPVNPRQLAGLRYNDWEISRKDVVEKAGKGKLGYLHLRAMIGSDMAAFAREFYAQYERDGLIIDVRRNNGGNIDSWIIEKLLRRVWAFWAPPGEAPYSNMQQTFRGHLVVLTDSFTYSDGETFAAGIKALKLAPLIGTRTAGAGVWLSDSHRLVDFGGARVAENAQFGVDGRWLIEGVGVTPDIEVENPPHATFNGEDKQLDAAITYLQKKLAEAPLKPFQAQPFPPLR